MKSDSDASSSSKPLPLVSNPDPISNSIFTERATIEEPQAVETKLTPTKWFEAQYPALGARYGEAVLEKPGRDETAAVTDINYDFIAATLGAEGTPASPVVFLRSNERFYQYDPEEGIYLPKFKADLIPGLSQILLKCASEADAVNVDNLRFRFRNSLNGVVERARSVLAVDDSFFEKDLTEFISCANGMLCLEDMKLRPFSPELPRRSKLSVKYEQETSCPLFLDTLLRPALKKADLDLLQRWCGMLLMGTNQAQKIMMITGKAGGGKGTLIRVLEGVIGQRNVGSLRTEHLNNRFEVGRLVGKTLLYGADVAKGFLNTSGASVLKSLTGGDPITVEFKGSNATHDIVCRFNVAVTCNSLPRIRLEGDAEAWRRRLAIVRFTTRPTQPIPDLSEQILSKEGSGVLNWMLAGFKNLRAEEWQLTMNGAQKGAVDNLIDESDAEAVFVHERLRAVKRKTLTAEKCYAGYVSFCGDHQWEPLSRKAFGNVIGALIAREFGLSTRHDIVASDGRQQRGWRGLRIK
jgi:putative DNA primase/helicase